MHDSVTHLGKDALACCIHVDILILNARVSSRSTFLETIPEVNAEVMQVNFLSREVLAKTIVPGMIQQQTGVLVWISDLQSVSIINLKHCATQVGLPERTYNVASKFATQCYCEGLRAELATSGVQSFRGMSRLYSNQSESVNIDWRWQSLQQTRCNNGDWHVSPFGSSTVSSRSDSHNVSFTL